MMPVLLLVFLTMLLLLLLLLLVSLLMLHALPAADEAGHLGCGGAVAWCFCVVAYVVGGVAHSEIIPGKSATSVIRIAILFVAAPAIFYCARGLFTY